jgi:hypothetical protein
MGQITGFALIDSYEIGRWSNVHIKDASVSAIASVRAAKPPSLLRRGGGPIQRGAPAPHRLRPGLLLHRRASLGAGRLLPEGHGTVLRLPLGREPSGSTVGAPGGGQSEHRGCSDVVA